jgi:hypothetical protein
VVPFLAAVDPPACVCSWARPEEVRCVTGERYTRRCPPGTTEYTTADKDRLRTFLRASVGRMRARDSVGDVQRFEIEGDWTDELARLTTHWGFVFGIERWETARATTLGIPTHLYFGPRLGPLFVSVGGGLMMLGYDALPREGGVSFLEPFALGAAGLDIARWVRVAFDARATYRWNAIEPHDRFVLQAGLSLSVRIDSDTR